MILLLSLSLHSPVRRNLNAAQSLICVLSLAVICALTGPTPAQGDVLNPENPTIRSNMCLGLECTDSETYGSPDDTILRIKNVRARIEFMDTTVGTNFPANSWAIQINDDGQFGQEYFAIQDLDNSGALPFRLMAGAPANALLVAGNGAIGLGTTLPQTGLHVQRSDGRAAILIEETSPGTLGQLTLRNNGTTFFALEDTSRPAGDNTGRAWNFQNQGGTFRVTTAPGGPGQIEMILTPEGDMTIKGDYYASSGTLLNVPDFVFAPNYALRPLSDVATFIAKNSHLPDVPSAETIKETGLNMTQMQMILLRKVEELTLYTIELEAARAANQTRLDALETRLNIKRP